MNTVISLLEKIPGASNEEVVEVATKLRRTDDLVTHKDLETTIAKLEARLIKQMYAISGVTLAVTLTGVGLMINFL